MNVEDMREWLDNHASTPPVACALCEEPVAKDTVVDHLMERHKHLDLAVLVALWWFLGDDDGE